MDKAEIRKILKNPSTELVNIALGYVNLTEKERKIIEYVEIKGITEERTAEILDISTRNVQTIKANAFEKINTVWSYNLFVSILLKRV